VPRSKPPYPAEFRQQIIELARAGRTPAELSREFGPTAQSIANGIAQHARDRGKPLAGKEGLTTAEREELARLRRQVRQLETERDILAKACVHGSPAEARRRSRRLRTLECEPGRCQDSRRAHPVPRAGRIKQWLLRLAATGTECACHGQRGAGPPGKWPAVFETPVDPAPAGSYMPIRHWPQYADHAVAPTCRSRTGSYTAVGDTGEQEGFI